MQGGSSMVNELRFGFALLAATLVGCEQQRPLASQPSTEPAEPVSFEQPLLEAAAAYKDFAQVSDNLGWTPTLCRSGPNKWLETATSAAAEGTPHGRKLYNLFARFPDEYRDAHTAPASVGQTIVKEAWLPSDTPEPGPFARTLIRRPAREAPAASQPNPTEWDFEMMLQEYLRDEREGEYVYVGAKAELFIMHRFDPATPGTDDGWIYGVVTPEGDRVIEAGLLENCMGCHQQHKSRLFGRAPGVWGPFEQIDFSEERPTDDKP